MESILNNRKQYNEEQGIWPSENKVIDRLLYRSTEMNEVYEELGRKLSHGQKENFWDAVLAVATCWTPDSAKKNREDKKELASLNSQIAACAEKLAKLLRQRYELCEGSGFSAYDDCHVLDWIGHASAHNYLYQSHLQDKLRTLAGQYDLKYWPRTFEVLEAVAHFAESAEVQTTDGWTEELISSQKSSNADYMRVLLKAIDDRKREYSYPYPLPVDFKLTDRNIANIINCTLDLDDEEIVTTEYVKRARQHMREKHR